MALTTDQQKKIEKLKTRRVKNLRVTVPFVLAVHEQNGNRIAILANGDIATSSWDELVRIWHPSNESVSATSRNWTCIGEFKVKEQAGRQREH